jgi:hypothetical protein
MGEISFSIDFCARFAAIAGVISRIFRPALIPERKANSIAPDKQAVGLVIVK